MNFELITNAFSDHLFIAIVFFFIVFFSGCISLNAIFEKGCYIFAVISGALIVLIEYLYGEAFIHGTQFWTAIVLYLLYFFAINVFFSICELFTIGSYFNLKKNASAKKLVKCIKKKNKEKRAKIVKYIILKNEEDATYPEWFINLHADKLLETAIDLNMNKDDFETAYYKFVVESWDYVLEKRD